MIVAGGVVGSLRASFSLTRLMSSLLFGVAATDPFTFASVSVLLVGVSLFFFFSSRRRHTRCLSDWSSDVCSSDLYVYLQNTVFHERRRAVDRRRARDRPAAERVRQPRGACGTGPQVRRSGGKRGTQRSSPGQAGSREGNQSPSQAVQPEGSR